MKHLDEYKTFEGKGPKGKDLSVFVRFGGVNLKPQEGYSKNPKSFHSPPAPKGFYAFPKVAQELFLIGSMDKFQPGTVPKAPEYPVHKEVDGKLSKEDLEKWEKDLDKHEERTKAAKSSMRKEFRKIDGNVWSHLGEYVKRSEVIDEHGSWVKTSIKEWQRAFNKMSLKHRMPDAKEFGMEGGNINNVRGITGWYSKDHCEVFFDEKV